MLLLGKPVAESLDKQTKDMLNTLAYANVVPSLVTVRQGASEDAISYEKMINRKCESFGIKVDNVIWNEDMKEKAMIHDMLSYGDNSLVDGIMVFRPLVNREIENKVCNVINSFKDVDCCSDDALGKLMIGKAQYAPCTAKAVIELLNYYNIPLEGKHIVVIGRSKVIGLPVAMMLQQRNATVTMCHSKSESLDIITRSADIVIVAVGKMQTFGKEYFEPWQTVIDVGIHFNSETQKMCGDVKDEVYDYVKAITPVPKGLGSVTTSVLVNQFVQRLYKDYEET